MDEYLLPPMSQFRVNPAYGPQKRKRGGLAGIWDRNKKVITPIAELAAGALGGPWASTAVGALAKGFDQPGGFNWKQAALGGLEGYGMGKVGQYGAGKLKKMFTAAPPPPAAALPTDAELVGQGIRLDESGALIGGDGTPYIMRTPPTPQPPAPTTTLASIPAKTPMPNENVFQRAGGKLVDLFQPGGFFYEKPEIAAGIAQGAIGAYSSAQDRKLALDEIQRQRDQQARLAALLMPMYEQYYGIGG